MIKADFASMTLRERKEYELKKVQQRTAALIVFAIVISVVSGLLGLSKVLLDQDRSGDATFLLAISAVVSMISVVVIRALLQQSLAPISWLFVAVIPTIATAVWVF